jgi:membrane protein implicated in regulation of membrane protease activity
MHPYVIILLLPLLGILVFFLLPLPQAIIYYLIILAISGLLYWAIIRVLKRRSIVGREGLIGAEARIISILSPHDAAQYMVNVYGELWNANSSDKLEPDDVVKILSVNGLTLTVEKIRK